MTSPITELNMTEVTKKSLLVLGAGRVAFPCVEYTARKHYQVTVVSNIEKELKQILEKLPDLKTELLNISTDPQRLIDLIANHDAVASLLPPHMQTTVGEYCINQKKPMISASYIGDDLRNLDENARKAGIVIIGDCGLDPGLDHMISMLKINAIKEEGGTIQSFSSICGGLPAAEFAEEPLKYKFSWCPKGALLSHLVPATYLEKGQVKEIAGNHILDDVRKVSDVSYKSMEFEVHPNRNALHYQELYGLSSATSMFRGTLRYKGFSSVMKSLIHLGLLSSDNIPLLSESAAPMTWREAISLLLKLPVQSSLNDVSEEWSKICRSDMVPMETILRLLIENEMVPKADSLIDSLTVYLLKKLSFAPDERDLVVMRNEIEYVQSNGNRKRITMDLVEEGRTCGSSAMSCTVGITVAAAASLVLEGQVKQTGVIYPVLEEIYKPVLDAVAKEGIEFKTSVIDI